MAEWTRSTRECRLDQMRPEMVDAIQRHLASYNLGPILDAPLISVETTSVKKMKGLFGGGEQTVVVGAIVTPRWLVWAIEEKSGVSVLSAQLRSVVILDYRDTPGYRLIPDAGVEMTGAFTGWTNEDGSQGASTFIGLGEEPEAAKFKEILKRAAQDAKL